MRIIDIHTHPVFNNEGSSKEEAERLVAYAKSLGIERMVALGDVLLYGPTPDAEQIASINDTTEKLLHWYPDFFIGFCYLNPLLGETALRRELDTRLENGFRGIKLEIANNARDPAMKPLMKAAENANIPVLQHTWAQSKRLPKSHSDPADTSLLARRFPNVQVIMAHLFGFGIRGVLEAKGIPNLYVDTSSCLPFSGLVEFAVEKLGAERILYGSDLPIRELGQCIGRISGSDITSDQKRAILFENARQLLDTK